MEHLPADIFGEIIAQIDDLGDILRFAITCKSTYEKWERQLKKIIKIYRTTYDHEEYAVIIKNYSLLVSKNLLYDTPKENLNHLKIGHLPFIISDWLNSDKQLSIDFGIVYEDELQIRIISGLKTNKWLYRKRHLEVEFDVASKKYFGIFNTFLKHAPIDQKFINIFQGAVESPDLGPEFQVRK